MDFRECEKCKKFVSDQFLLFVPGSGWVCTWCKSKELNVTLKEGINNELPKKPNPYRQYK